ncbi:TrkH family potassium uptake protein [Mycoplasmopsis lipofaciens]|uniref:TrkH family potassium uptake protein n=1 Tax=Mycoplasmopsis lipofaciens TaxID=114884 RepID=UPI000485C876|nr:potassium transporter TrkG [Mycoplasmopsis lipofaciens]
MKNLKIGYLWRNSKLRNFFLNYLKWKKNITKVRFIFLIYLLVVIIGTFLLYSPITHSAKYSNWNSISFWDAFFTTCSAFSDTGLVTKTTYDTWNMFGQTIIAILIFSGGLGIFALKIFLISLLFFNNKSSLSEVELVNFERGSTNSRQTKKVVIDSIGLLLIIFLVFSILLSFYFFFATPSANSFPTVTNTNNVYNDSNKIIGEYVSPQNNWALSFRYGFFHCISALNNAGFDIIGQNSLIPYYKNIDLQIIFLFLFIVGGLGYPVIHDFLNFIRFKMKYPKRKYYWALLSKISALTYLIVSIVGFILLISFEASNKGTGLTNFWKQDGYYGNKGYKIWALIFTTASTRSAGFATINMADLTHGSIMTNIILMFIGAAPASTGGGIRTTTFAILILSIISKMIGKPSVRSFKRKIEDQTVRMSAIVFSISLFIVLVISFITMSSMDYYYGSIDSKKMSYIHVLFETVSAFGTTGLSSGITAHYNIASKIFISILMFIGQFGISSTILIWGSKHNFSYKYEYISEEVTIG